MTPTDLDLLTQGQRHETSLQHTTPTDLDLLTQGQRHEAQLCLSLTFLLLYCAADESDKVCAQVSTEQCLVGRD